MDDEESTTPEASETAEESEHHPTTLGLRRSHENSVLAGVCAGISERLEIDANIVRVGFILATFLWGVGAIVYLALWVLLPIDDASTSDAPPLEGASRRPLRRLTSSLAAVLIVLVALGVFASLFHHQRFAPGFFMFWVIGTLLIVLALGRRRGRAFSLVRLVASLVSAVLSLVVIAALVLAVYVWSTGVPITGGTGVRLWHPTSTKELLPAYRTAIGSETVNLTAVKFERPTTITASVAVGSLIIKVPRDVRLTVNTHVGLGSVFYWHASGPLILSGLGAATPSKGATLLVIDASVGVGRLEIARP